MSDAPDGGLQFDSVGPPPIPGSDTVRAGVTCASSEGAITDAYFDVNGQSVCRTCHERLVAHGQTPQELGLFVRAAAFGLGAAIAGAVLYYAVIAITNFEIGLVAIAIGYMVGYGVRAGAKKRGGRRFQVLAVVLTYLSVSMAYTILAFRAASDESSQSSGTVTDVAGETPSASGPEAGREPRRTEALDAGQATAEADSRTANSLPGIAFLVGFCLALPFIVIFGSLPSGLISAAIIVFVMQQAWRMTMAPVFTISGPYRVGTSVAASVG